MHKTCRLLFATSLIALFAWGCSSNHFESGSETSGEEQESGSEMSEEEQASGEIAAEDSNELSARIPASERGVMYSAEEIRGVSRLMNPGDRIDVLATYRDDGDFASRRLLQAVTLLAVDQCHGATQPGRECSTEGKTVTLALTPEEAQLIDLAIEAGRVRLLMRNREDLEISKSQIRTFTGILEELELLETERAAPAYNQQPR